ncbi:MAG: response regulator [Chroococcidiopsidaceae cyanobacterium CP_BM_ER_R8_30]|nr:response regulator [Chroococcidiopsidaceae cyanobacterium CP_BM_ER_R8_30]
MKILLIEDEIGSAEVLKNTLTAHNYIVDTAKDGQVGLELAAAFSYNLILLDILLPKLDGIEFCRKLRQSRNNTPVLLLTALETSTSKVIGLDAGADDYVVKPFDSQELLARIRALLRRGSSARPFVLEAGNIRIDTSSCRVTCADQLLHLTAKEYALLELLLRNSHRIFSQQLLLDHLWPLEIAPTENTVRTHIKALRQKLKQSGADVLIETVYGLGYRIKLGAEVEHPATVSSQLSLSGSATVGAPSESKIPSALAAIWQRFQPKYGAHAKVIEQAIAALMAGTLKVEQAQQAQQTAHLLIGSLASFGLAEASRLAREIEQIFRAGVNEQGTEVSSFEHAMSFVKRSQAHVKRLEQLAVALRQELEQAAPSLESPAPLSPTIKQPRLLIVVNDAQLGAQLAREARIWGIQAEVVTLTQAREAIAAKCPDIVLLDWIATSSLELLAELAVSRPTLPVLVLMAEEDFVYRVQVARLGGQIWGQKPIVPAAILATVSQTLQQPDIVLAHIMIVDDDLQMLDRLRTLLLPWGFQLTLLHDPQQFWTVLKQSHPDLLILDFEMPQLSGIDLCRVVRNDSQWSELPVLFLSAYSDPETVNRVFTAGADDYVSKPVVGPELVARILNRLERTHRLRRLAETDLLTGIANRRKSISELTRLLHLAERQRQPLCFVILDLDHFKLINDRYGHEAGDQVLRQFGTLLQQNFRSEDVIARWGGEEFVVGLYGATQQQSQARIMQLQRAMYQQEFTSASGQKFQVTFSGGMAEFPANGTELQVLYHNADAALYQAKVEGRNRVVSSRLNH